MKIRYAITLSFFLLSIFRSPAQGVYNYATNMANLPTLKKTYDGSVGVGISWGSGFNAFDVQGVFSPYRNVAVMINHFNAVDKDVKNGRDVGSSFSLTEIGAGVYKALPRGSASCMVGYGQGKLFTYYGLGKNASFSIQRFFVQPSINYIGEYFTSGLGIRVTQVRHSEGNIDYAIDSYYLNAVRMIEEETPFFLPELCVQAGLHVHPFYFLMHFNIIFPSVDEVGFSQANIGMSARVSLGKKG